MAAVGKAATKYNEVSGWEYMVGKRLVDQIDIKEGYNVLDIGCATGELTAYLASKVGVTGKVLGFDPDEQRIAVAREQFKDIPNLDFFIGSITDISSECLFDVVFSSHVFHYIEEEDFVSGLTKIRSQLMNPGASLVFQTLIDEPLILSMAELLPENRSKEFKGSLLLRGGEDYERLMKLAGFEEVHWEHVPSSFVYDSKEDYFAALYSTFGGLIDVSLVAEEKLNKLEWKYSETGGVIVEDLALVVFVKKETI